MPSLPTISCSQAPLDDINPFCKRCNHRGCDVRIIGCECYYHARCCTVSRDNLLSDCPGCGQNAKAIHILPMIFDELDLAQQEAVSASLPTDKRGRKRKIATIARFSSVVAAEESLNVAGGDSTVGLRSGRWTDEEAVFCDKLIELFEQGKLPIPDGIRLNDFLSNMLKSKPSRLTKKMKNAKLSARQYKRESGIIDDDDVATDFSRLENEFITSIKCNMERSEIKFHMGKEWRESFSSYCVSIGQRVDAYDWMKSVEELDRRVSEQHDAARIARRKLMMGQALEKDMEINAAGVFIDQTSSTSLALDSSCYRNSPPTCYARIVSSDSSKSSFCTGVTKSTDGIRYYSSPFIKRLMQYMLRHNVPFEHVDVWAPSFTDGGGHGFNVDGCGDSTHQRCRLCFAGFGTMETRVPQEGGTAIPMTCDDIFDLLSFGEYSEKFSFDVGCGVPGRVYSSGVASWEQGIQNAPISQFERIGGAQQWAIQTVLGIPIPSPNVERIVVLFYSAFDRPQNLELVNSLSTELSNMLPTPRWNLVVDIGVGTLPVPADSAQNADIRSTILSLIDLYMPKDKNSPLAMYLPGFTSLRLLLAQEVKSEKSEELLNVVMGIFLSCRTGKSDADTITSTARYFMALTKKDSRSHCAEVSSMTNDYTEISQSPGNHAVSQRYETNEFSNQFMPEPYDVGITFGNNSSPILPLGASRVDVNNAPNHQFDNKPQNHSPFGLLMNDDVYTQGVSDDYCSLNASHLMRQS